MTTVSLATILAEGAHWHPDKVAVVDGVTRVTYRDLWARARSYAGGLHELDVRPGDTVALLVPNVLDFPRVYYAALAAGARVVPISPFRPPDEIAHVLADSGADLLVAHSSRLTAGATAAHLAGVRLATVGPLPVGLVDAPPGLEDAAAVVPPLRTFVSRQAGDVAVVSYPAGTPKAVPSTHLNLVMNATMSDTRESDVVLGCLPLYDTSGQTVGMNGTFRPGGTLVLQAQFRGEDAIDLMVREKVTVFQGVPTMYLALLEAAPKTERLPELRLCVCAGETLAADLRERFAATFRTRVSDAYALSEGSAAGPPAYGASAGAVADRAKGARA